MSDPEPVEVDITVRKKGRTKGTQNKERAILPADAFVMEDTDPDERGAIRRQRLERTEQQKAIDAKTLAVYREWVADGSPRDWLDMPVKKWAIEKRYIDDAVFYLGKGASLHGKKLVVGNITDKDENGRTYPDRKWRIPFCVIDRDKRTINKNSASGPVSLPDS
jgi:hypothetical protein